jgi:hypothetical protein
MGKEELVGYSKKFIAEKGISGRHELEKADSGLYYTLMRRKLLDEVGLGSSNANNRDWTVMGKEGLVGYAKEFIAKKGIVGRRELEKADARLYNALRRRKLLDAVFSERESSGHADAVQGVLDALESFGDEE